MPNFEEILSELGGKLELNELIRRWPELLEVAKDIANVKDNEAFLREIQRQAKIGGWSLDVSTMAIAWTDETYRIHGLDPSSKINVEDGMQYYHPDYQARIRQCILDGINLRMSWDEEFVLVTANGEQIWVRATGHPVEDDTGNVNKIIGTFQNVDSQRRISEQLLDTANQLSDILEHSPGMVYQFKLARDGQMFFTYASSQTFDIYEIAPEEFKRSPAIMLEMAHPEDVASLQKKIEESAETLSQFEWDGRIIAASGKIKHIKAKSHPRQGLDNSIIWNGVVVDVTRERDLEIQYHHQLRVAEHSSRLASIGELAAGVGHEINNPLAIVVGLLSKTVRQIEHGDFTLADLKETILKQQDACGRIKKIVDGLRTFARDGDQDEVQQSNITDAVHSTLALVSEIYRSEGIEVRFLEPTSECHVSCSAPHLQQVLMNLLSNARDAVSSQKDPWIGVSIKEDGKFCRLAVSDNGCGIPKHLGDRIFDSFFTTKDVGDGMGLGLALSRSLVENSGGAITFDSGDGGTTFYVSLPIVEAIKKVGAVDCNSQPETTTMLRALVVDDEEGIREIIGFSLRDLNCLVTEASSATLALAEIKRQDFDLIITDLRMPGMDGLTLLSEIASSRLAPNAMKVVTTGGIADGLAAQSSDFRFGLIDAFLGKPFTDEDIAAVVYKARKRLEGKKQSA